MKIENILGIDLGGTNIRGGIVNGNELSGVKTEGVNANGSLEGVLNEVYQFIDQFISHNINAIGIGVPGLVSNGKVFDVINIPSWKEIPLKNLIEDHYQLPVAVNNDANCFALGEFYFGKGKEYHSMIGLTIGTGLGSGIIIHKKLYAGSNGGAGEFGMMDYLDQCYEYYASGQFFQNVYGINGEEVFNQAKQGNKAALNMYEEMGMHLGNAIKAILYATDVELIVLGGSVRHAFPYFSKSMWKQVETFAYKTSIQRLKIEVAKLENSGVPGAAALHYDLQ
jgi:glucokinase